MVDHRVGLARRESGRVGFCSKPLENFKGAGGMIRLRFSEGLPVCGRRDGGSGCGGSPWGLPAPKEGCLALGHPQRRALLTLVPDHPGSRSPWFQIEELSEGWRAGDGDRGVSVPGPHSQEP